MCQNYETGPGCKFGDKCPFRHVEADSQPVKGRSKVVDKDRWPCGGNQVIWVAHSWIQSRRGEVDFTEEARSDRTVHFSKGTLRPVKNRERKGPSQ